MNTTRLSILTEYGLQAGARAAEQKLMEGSDELAHLAPERRAAWIRLLSSTATTESMEGTLMEPLLAAARAGGDRATLAYLESHKADESRHHQLLAGYLKRTFGYEKTHRTLMDRVLYDRVFVAIASAFRRKPIYGYAILLGYERFTIPFYAQLKASAVEDGATKLVGVIQSIEKDELRHVAGMEHLLRETIRANGGLGLGDLTAVSAILGAVMLDVDMSPWAFHNREVRAHLQVLGFDTDEVTQVARRARRGTLALMSETHRSLKGVGHVAVAE